MLPDSSPPPFAPYPDRGPAIEEQVDELARLARSEITPADFYASLLGKAVQLLAAIGAAVWLRAGHGTLRRQHETSVGGDPWARAEDPWHARLLVQSLQSTQASAVMPDSPGRGPGTGGLATLRNPGPYLLVFAPLVGERESYGVLELVLRADGDPAATAGYVQLAGVLGELAADFEHQQQLRELLVRQSLWGRIEQFVRHVHAYEDVDRTAYEIANEGRVLIGCDRLSVATWDGDACHVRAVSGVEAFDTRSNSVRGLENLVDATLAVGDPLWSSDEMDDLAPTVAARLHTYLDQSNVRRLAILPLRSTAGRPATEADESEPPLGALVVEQFTGEQLDDGSRARMGVVAEHAAIALRHVVLAERMPLARLSRWFTQTPPSVRRRRRRRGLALVVLLAAAVFALSTIQTEFTVEARGTLEPAEQREVFAAADGVVDQLKVEHGSHVTAGEPLIVLRKPQLEFEFSRIAGELQTGRKRLAAVQASRLVTNPADSSELEKYNQLTGEEEELKELLRSLEQQDKVLRAQREELTLRSPMTGQVLTWDVEQLLAARPVQRGQALLTVADVAGAWLLDLHVPDDQAGYLLRAERDAHEPLEVSFILQASPEQVHKGRVQNVALTTDLDEDDHPMVMVTVAVDRQALSPLRPRASVVGKIHCGRRAVGFVWFHGLWHAVQSRLLF